MQFEEIATVFVSQESFGTETVEAENIVFQRQKVFIEHENLRHT